MIVTCEKCQNQIYVRQKPRSRNENSYYWSVIVGELAEYTGFEPEEIHEHLKWRFLRIVRGKLETVRSTSSLSVAEFEDYLSKIRMWASQELNCYLPLPNEVSDD